jgi:hypothetical protein
MINLEALIIEDFDKVAYILEGWAESYQDEPETVAAIHSLFASIEMLRAYNAPECEHEYDSYCDKCGLSS